MHTNDFCTIDHESKLDVKAYRVNATGGTDKGCPTSMLVKQSSRTVLGQLPIGTEVRAARHLRRWLHYPNTDTDLMFNHRLTLENPVVEVEAPPIAPEKGLNHAHGPSGAKSLGTAAGEESVKSYVDGPSVAVGGVATLPEDEDEFSVAVQKRIIDVFGDADLWSDVWGFDRESSEELARLIRGDSAGEHHPEDWEHEGRHGSEVSRKEHSEADVQERPVDAKD